MFIMQKHPKLTRQRIAKCIADGVLWRPVYPERVPVALQAFAAPGRITYAEAMRGRYRPIKLGHRYGPEWSTHWVRVEGRVPAHWRGREVRLWWDSSSEACVWMNGVPHQGLTGSGITGWGNLKGPIRAEYVLTRRARAGERITCYVEVACNQLFGLDMGAEQVGQLRGAELAVFDPEAWALYIDFVTVVEMMQQIPADQPRGAQALYTANAFLNHYDPDDRGTWGKARRLLQDYLRAQNGDGQHTIHAIGHAHIDTAWLWPLAETKRKCYRSFSSVLRLMEDHPDFVFACSQAQQYAWLKAEQPALYKQIKARVRKGQFVPVGGTWIEPDCNIPSGESLVRQFLYGQRFFKREFGQYCRGFWNPDVFGYNGQLPQIIRGAGLEWFLTQKLSWNQINQSDAHTFWWEGIDGTRVLTHFPPADTYVGNASIKELLFQARNYKDLDRSNDSVYLFGFGDGGGGPTREMLARLERVKDTDGVPRVKLTNPDTFFEALRQNSQPLVEKVGELYLELHRGTFTTHADVKRNNRRAEEALHDVELLSAFVGGKYPARSLARAWQALLLNQFHDIIPGSSITEVYEDAARDYAALFAALAPLKARALRKLAKGTGPRWLVVNTLDRPRREVVQGPDRQWGLVTAPPCGYTVCVPTTTPPIPVKLRETKSAIWLENEMVRVKLDRKGRCRELSDRQTGHSSLAGPANRFRLYEDKPSNFDAWDIDIHHREKPVGEPQAAECQVVEATPLRAAVRFTYTLSPRSRLVQTVRVDAARPVVEFETEVEWHETQRLLKVEFPTQIRAEQATYEIPFGHVQRPTHYNNSHDLARFEVCGHRWADLSEPGAGLALINDCKYGYSAHRGVLSLSLLRAPLHPDPRADRGAHTFRYALCPHAGDWRAADIPTLAAAFNQPLEVRPTRLRPVEQSWITVDHPAIRVDTVKQAEDSNDLVVRLYEQHGGHAATCLTTAKPVAQAWQTNLLEEDRQELKIRRQAVPLTFRPFEIKTLCLRHAP